MRQKVEKPKILETDLYLPIKNLLISRGYEVKSEIGKADVMAVKEDETPIIVELKTSFSLTLFHQAIERQSITDHVYIAVPKESGKRFQTSLKRNKSLCRRLSLGLILIRLSDGFTEVILDPTPYQPRKSKTKQTQMLKEFSKRIGDPNMGGSIKEVQMTAYRQDALKCLFILYDDEDGALKASDIAKKSGVEKARNLVADNHYGWFERVERGIYALTAKGIEAHGFYQEDIQAIKENLEKNKPTIS